MTNTVMENNKEKPKNEESPSKKPAMGAYLRSVRLKKGLSEDDVHQKLKIKARIIKAIENQHYTILPDTVTVSALVRQYAHFLGLDPTEIGHLYKQEMQGTDQKIEVVFPDKLPSSFRPFKNAIFLTLFMIIAYFGWQFINNIDDILPEITPISDMITNVSAFDDADMSDEALSMQNDIATLEIIPNLHFKILAAYDVFLKSNGGDSWIEVKSNANRRVIYSAILKDGQSYKIPSNINDLRLKAGNSAPLSIEVNGKKLGLLPKNSRVLRNFNIDHAFLIDYYNKMQ